MAWRRLMLCVLSGLGIACAPDLYLSESDVAAFVANARSEAIANETLAGLDGQRLDIRFRHTGQVLGVRSSNTVDFLRAMPKLAFLETVWEQIDLQRLADQLDAQLAAWMNEQIALVPQQTDGNARITRLARAWLRVEAPPEITFDAGAQTIAFRIPLRSEITARLRVRGDDYNAGVSLDAMTLRGAFRFQDIGRDATRVVVSLDPELSDWRVTGISSRRVRGAVRTFLTQLLGSPRQEFHTLRFDHFALSNLAIETSAVRGTELALRYHDRAPNASPIVDIVNRNADGELLHTRRRQNGFATPSKVPLPKRAAGDPALVSSAPGELDLVVVAEDGELFHSHYDGERWLLRFSSFSGGVQHRYRAEQRLALVATGPGALEMIAVADDGRLRHLRRINGVWTVPAGVPDLQQATGDVHRDPIAQQITQKLLVVFRDNQSRVRGVAFDLETAEWGQSFSIESGVEHAPSLASLGHGSAYLSVVGSGGRVRGRKLFVSHLWFTRARNRTGVSLGPVEMLGGRLSGAPTTVNSGDGQLELFGRGLDQRLWHQRLTAGPVGTAYGRTLRAGWQGWQPAGARFFGTPASAAIMPEIAAGSTRDGEVHLATRMRSSGASWTLHNRYPSWRFGKAPWRAVHWRGLERIARERFVGTPAIAISDRSLSLVLVDVNQKLWDASVGDGAAFGFRESYAGLRARHPSDPALISAGPGRLSVFAVGADGQPRHLRRHGGSTGLALPEATPAPVASSLAIAPGGDGDLDLAGVTQGRELYHWRYRKGEWWIHYPVANDVISSPAIVRTGSGQLELFAVGSDRRLRRWRYRAAAWSEVPAIAAPISVSAVYFGPASATATGDGQVDVVIAEDGTGELHHAHFGPGEAAPVHPMNPLIPQPFGRLGIATADVPMLTALASGRLHLLVPSREGVVVSTLTEVHRPRTTAIRPGFGGWLERFRLREPTVLLGRPQKRWESPVPVLGRGFHVASVTRTAAQELALVASSRDQMLFLKRYRGWRWLGTDPLGGDLPPLPAGRPVRVIATPH